MTPYADPPRKTTMGVGLMAKTAAVWRSPGMEECIGTKPMAARLALLLKPTAWDATG